MLNGCFAPSGLGLTNILLHAQHSFSVKNTFSSLKNFFKFLGFHSFIHLTVLDIGSSMVRKNTHNHSLLEVID